MPPAASHLVVSHPKVFLLVAGRRVVEKLCWQAAKGFNPNINITPHHGNIKDKKFGVQVHSRNPMVHLANFRLCPLLRGGTLA